ncbi:MAG TPA: hypothetical protein VGG05_11190 [Pseudonocardiaceae bacterium]
MRPAQVSTETVMVPSDTDGTPDESTPTRSGWRGLARVHWLFGVFLLVGVGLRVVTWLAYQPAIFYTDAYRYLDNIGPENPQYLDPIGYSLYILKPLVPIGGVGLVVAVQHLAGIGMALVVYHLAVKLGARRWLAALATAPVLLDAYQLQIEQQVLSDVWLEVMLVVLLWLLIGRKVPAAGWFAVAGLVVGLAMTIRFVAISVIIPVAIYAVLAGRQWRVPGGWRRIAARVGALGGCFLVVVAAYATYFHSKAGYWGLNTASGNTIYGRTAEVADCSKLDLDEVLQQLCPKEPLGHRLGTNVYSHLDGFQPGWPGYVPPGETVYDLDKKFAKQVILHQPVTVALAVLEDFGKGFLPYHFSLPGDPPTWLWQFSRTTPLFTVDPTSNPAGAFDQTNAYAIKYGHRPLHTIAPLAAFLHYYQYGGYTPGPLLFGMLVLGLIGGLGRRGRRSGLAGVTMLTTGVAFTVLFTAALFEFSWRYQLPGLVLLPLAGALGITALIKGRAAVSAPPPAD